MTNKYYTVVVPVYNQKEATLTACLQSVYDTKYSLFEVIVVNDGSDDQSSAVKQFPCQLINLPEHRGSSFARNAGAKKARYDILVFVDSDAVISQDYFRRLNEFFNKNPLYCCVSAVPIFSDRYRANLISQYYNLRYEYSFYQMGMPSYTLLSSCFAIKKDCFFDVEGFDEEVPSSFADDIVLGWRLSSAGYKLAFDNQISFSHLKIVGFLNLIRIIFLHSYYYSKFFFKYRFSKKPYLSSVVNRDGVRSIILMAMLITALLLPLSKFYKILIALTFTLLILLNQRRFLCLIGEKKNPLFLGMSIIMIMFEIFVLLCGSIVGTSHSFIDR